MSWSTDSSYNIRMSKGETPAFVVQIEIRGDDHELHIYEPVEGDVVTFSLKDCCCDTVDILTKDVPIDTMALVFDNEDTLDLPCGEYVYTLTLHSGEYVCEFLRRKLVLH